jgi:hypothetical protein
MLARMLIEAANVLRRIRNFEENKTLRTSRTYQSMISFHFALSRLEIAAQQLQERGLAHAVRSHNRHTTGQVDTEINVAEQRLLALERERDV